MLIALLPGLKSMVEELKTKGITIKDEPGQSVVRLFGPGMGNEKVRFGSQFCRQHAYVEEPRRVFGKLLLSPRCLYLESSTAFPILICIMLVALIACMTLFCRLHASHWLSAGYKFTKTTHLIHKCHHAVIAGRRIHPHLLWIPTIGRSRNDYESDGYHD